MKIMFIANSSGGLYGFRRHFMKALIDKGHHIVALAPLERNVEELEAMGVAIFHTPMDRRGTNPLIDFRLFCQYRHFIKSEKPDFVITYTIKPNIYGGLACRLTKTAYASNVTGLGTAFEKGGLLGWFVKKMSQIGLKEAKTVFFENRANREMFVKEQIVDEPRTYVLHGAGVDLSHFVCQDYPDNDEEFHFLFIGRIMKEKGIDELLESMEKLAVHDGIRCCLDILGWQEEDYEETLQRCFEKGWLYYHGMQSDVRPFIRDCDCLVLPSYHEGMSNANLEGAACGRPLITSNILGCREAVMDGKSGFLCEPKDADSLYQAMKRMCGLSMEERKRMGLTGRKHMEEVFDKRRVVEETVRRLGL